MMYDIGNIILAVAIVYVIDSGRPSNGKILCHGRWEKKTYVQLNSNAVPFVFVLSFCFFFQI